MLFRVFAILVLLACQDSGWVTYQGHKVSALEGQVLIQITLEVEEGYHIQEVAPADPYLVPTKLALALPGGWVVDSVSFPKPEPWLLEGTNDTLGVYGGSLIVEVYLKTGGMPLKGASIPATLSYQACDHAKCFFPRELKFLLEF